MGTGLRRRTVYLVTAAAMIAMLGGWTLAVSTTSTGPTQNTNITVTSPGGFTTASVVSTHAVVVSPAIAAYTNAGTQSATTAGLAGTPLALAVCASGPCFENHLAVNGPAVTAGDYALQIEVAVIQPASSGASAGLDFQVESIINGGTLVFSDSYLATGVSSAGTAQTVNVYIFMDLGTQTAPAVNSISIQFNSCLTATACP
jgi:hypothetical protein